MAISVSSVGNLKPWQAVVTIEQAGAISHGFGYHPSVWLNNDATYRWEGTVYTANGEFDANTAVIYSDSYGTPLERCDIVCSGVCDKRQITLASKSHPYEMTLPGFHSTFNKQVQPISNYRLPYKTACWLSRSDEYGPYEPSYPLDNWWKCTYITAYHDGTSILNSTNISTNLYGGQTVRENSSSLYNGNPAKPIWWLTEVEEQSNGTHIGHAISPDTHSGQTLPQCYPWAYAVPLNDTVRGYSIPQYTYTSTYLRPKHEISCHYGGNGTWPFYALPNPAVTYHFQDAFNTGGTVAYSNGADSSGGIIPHLHEKKGGYPTNSNWPNSYYVPSTSKLITCAPLYTSNTPNFTGGTSNRTMAASGWYQHSSKNAANDPFFYWDASSYTWTDYTAYVP